MKVILVALYSEKYPSIGESHGISVIAGAIINKCSHLLSSIKVIDMVATGSSDIDTLKNTILDYGPDVIGFSVGFGTYDILRDVFFSIKEYVESHHCLFLLGGAIPTYLQKKLIDNIYSNFVLIIGEGDEATPEVVNRWYEGNNDYSGIPNLLYKAKDKYVFTLRKLVHPKDILIPYRGNIEAIYKSGAQVFVESSRGCGWSSCTFCLRGLTDVRGKKDEYRRLDFNRIGEDLLNLRSYNVNVFTFADEDFLGGSLDENTNFVDWFEGFCNLNNMKLSFDVSMTISSIYSNDYSSYEHEAIRILLLRLKNIGLRKIFLGIESGSNSQLKRFAKGHSAHEAKMAITVVKDIPIGLEVGFIMFDPLCTLEEVRENIDFLKNNDIVQFTSFFTNELRLQVSSNYLRLLEVFESRNNITLHSKNLDFNTLSYDYQYSDHRVESLIGMIKNWNTQLRPIHYPLKNLTRYGEGGILGNNREYFLNILFEMRNDYLAFLKNIIQGFIEETHAYENDNNFKEIKQKAATEILKINNLLKEKIVKYPIFETLIESCNKELSQ